MSQRQEVPRNYFHIHIKIMTDKEINDLSNNGSPNDPELFYETFIRGRMSNMVEFTERLGKLQDQFYTYDF